MNACCFCDEIPKIKTISNDRSGNCTCCPSVFSGNFKGSLRLTFAENRVLTPVAAIFVKKEHTPI